MLKWPIMPEQNSPNDAADAAPETSSLSLPHTEEPDWNACPEWLSVPQAAELLTVAKGGPVSPANVRTRLARGEFPGAVKNDRDETQIPRPDVQAKYTQLYQERTAKTGLVRRPGPETGDSLQTARQGVLSPPVAAMLARIDAQHGEQVALWQARLDDAQAYARHVEREVEHLRDLLREREETMREREETTRETLTHMDMVYEENKVRIAESVAQGEAEAKRQAEAHRLETARLWDELAAAQESAKESAKKRKLFGWGR